MTKLPILPAAYKNFLKTHDGETEYIFDEIDGWRFYSTEELTEVIRINGRLSKEELDRHASRIAHELAKQLLSDERPQ